MIARVLKIHHILQLQNWRLDGICVRDDFLQDKLEFDQAFIDVFDG